MTKAELAITFAWVEFIVAEPVYTALLNALDFTSEVNSQYIDSVIF